MLLQLEDAVKPHLRTPSHAPLDRLGYTMLDGSLFHKCARELEFDHSSPEIQHIKNSWHLIENSRGVFQFEEEAFDN